MSEEAEGFRVELNLECCHLCQYRLQYIGSRRECLTISIIHDKWIQKIDVWHPTLVCSVMFTAYFITIKGCTVYRKDRQLQAVRLLKRRTKNFVLLYFYYVKAHTTELSNTIVTTNIVSYFCPHCRLAGSRNGREENVKSLE